MKRYRTTKGQLSLPYNGKRIVFECRDYPYGYYSTSDKEEIGFIEGLKDFGTYITIDGEAEEEKPQEKNLDVVEVASWQEAKALLVEKGLKASDINSPAKIKNVALELGIEFNIK